MLPTAGKDVTLMRATLLAAAAALTLLGVSRADDPKPAGPKATTIVAEGMT